MSVRSLKPTYTFDKLRMAKKKEVIDEVNNQLNSFETTTGEDGSDRAGNTLNAQFLMQELARRDENRQACIVIVCAITMTLMTVVLVYFSWRSLSVAH